MGAYKACSVRWYSCQLEVTYCLQEQISLQGVLHLKLKLTAGDTHKLIKIALAEVGLMLGQRRPDSLSTGGDKLNILSRAGNREEFYFWPFKLFNSVTCPGSLKYSGWYV